jgi:hypothetical protein
MLLWVRVKRIKSNYHALQVLKSVNPKLRKVSLSNCNKELLNSIYECALNILNGNLKLKPCGERKLREHKSILCKIADKRLPLAAKRKVIVQQGGFLLPLLSAAMPVLATLFSVQTNMLHKMYLVSENQINKTVSADQNPPQTKKY